MKRITICVIGLFACILLSGQSLSLSFKSSEVLLIEQAIKDGMFMLSQEYQLEDTLTNKRYSLDNQPYFGKDTSFAVMTKDGILTSPFIIRPWDKDSRYQKYKNREYRPVISKTTVLTAADTTWRESALFCPRTICNMQDSLWVAAKDTVYNKGFSCDTLRNDSDGWLVWLVSQEVSEVKPLSLVTYRFKNESTEQNRQFLEGPNIGGTVLGGVFIVPSFESIGSIDLKLCGILSQNNKGWDISPVFALPESGSITINEDDVPVLTPVEPDKEQEAAEATGKHGKKNKKNNRNNEQ